MAQHTVTKKTMADYLDSFYPFLSLLPILLLLLLLLLLSVLAFTISKERRCSNPPPPGPPKLPIVGNLHQLGKTPHRSLHKLSKKYGPLLFLKLGQVPVLVVSSPEMAKEVLKTHDIECCSRPPTVGPKRLSYNFLDVALTPFGDHWKAMRRVFALELSSTTKLKSFAPLRKNLVSSFIDSISKDCHPTSLNPINLSEAILVLTQELVSNMAFSKSYGARHAQALNEAMKIMGSFSASDFFPFFGRIIDVLSGLHSRREKCFSYFDEFYQSVIDDHADPDRLLELNNTGEHEDIVDMLLRLSKEDESFTPNHIKGFLVNVFLGGTDTTSIAIIWAMTELVKNPRVMKKLQLEIRRCVKGKPMVEESDMENLLYLHMVFKETMRLHPPAVLLIPHQTMRHFKIGGLYDVYPGTRIYVNVWAIGRDPAAWENPEEFYPERFADKDIDVGGQNFELVPFGAGRRMCPAVAMGTTHVEFVLANLLYCFDWELPGGMKGEDISMEEEVKSTVGKKEPLYLVPVKYDGTQGED